MSVSVKLKHEHLVYPLIPYFYRYFRSSESTGDAMKDKMTNKHTYCECTRKKIESKYEKIRTFSVYCCVMSSIWVRCFANNQFEEQFFLLFFKFQRMFFIRTKIFILNSIGIQFIILFSALHWAFNFQTNAFLFSFTEEIILPVEIPQGIVWSSIKSFTYAQWLSFN